MITEKVNINGIEYQVSSTTYRGLQQAKQSLTESISNFEMLHPSSPIPQKAEPYRLDPVDEMVAEAEELIEKAEATLIEPEIKQDKKGRSKGATSRKEK